MLNRSGFISSHAAGDVAMIQPSNLPDVVDDFIELFKLDADQVFLLEQNDPGMYVLSSSDSVYSRTPLLWTVKGFEK